MKAFSAIGARVIQTLFVLWAVVTILFFLFRLMPGSPLAAYIDPNFTPEQQDALMARFGLDKPLWQQYFIYLGNLLQGDLGESFFYRTSVADRIFALLPNTLILTFSSLILAYGIGVLAGAYLAWKRGGAVEQIAIPLVLTTRAMPEFWLGMILLAVFSFSLGWFPAGGTRPPGADYPTLWSLYTSADFWRHMTLPVLTLAIYAQGLPLLLMRSNMLDVMKEDFVTMARIKGLSSYSVVIRHAARNALLPVMTSFAIAVGYQIQGNVVVETVFSWPGTGFLLGQAIFQRDLPLLQGAILTLAMIFVALNLLVDIVQSLLDPRVQRS